MDCGSAPEHFVIGVSGNYQKPPILGHTLSVSRCDTTSQEMLTAHAFLPTATIESLGPAPLLPAGLEAEVERLWQAEQNRRGKALFNGYILSATEIAPARIAGRR